MFEEIKERFYESLAKSIKDRRKFLKVIRDDILPDPKRVTEIEHIICDEHHPYLIGRDEYPRLIYLFLCKDHDSFEKLDISSTEVKILKGKCNNNYDKMLWGHIDWDKMFQDVITELSKLDISENLGKLFENTLTDYVPYAVIRDDELDPRYAQIWIDPETRAKRAEKRQRAIERVHLEHGSEFFKQTFLEKFSGKTLVKFDTKFLEFISDYLVKKEPNKYSFGSQAYDYHKNLSKFAADWQSLPVVQWGDGSDEEWNLEKLLRKYINSCRTQMKKLEIFQKAFDKLYIDVK